MRRWLFVATLAVPGLAFPAVADPAAPSVADSSEIVVSVGGSDSLTIRRLVFPSPVRSAVLDSASGVLLVSCEGAKIPVGGGQRLSQDFVPLARTVAYDLARRRVLWSREWNEVPTWARDGRVATSMGDRPVLRRLSDAGKIADLAGELYVYEDDSLLFTVSDEALTAYEAENGSVAWRAERGQVTGPAGLIERDGRLVLAAEGVQVIDPATGRSWSYPLPSSRGSVFSLPGGTGHVSIPTIGSLFGRKQVRGLSAMPLVRAGRLYFAAETTVVCLDLESGRCLWRRELRRAGPTLRQRALGGPPAPQFPGRLLLRDAGENVLVASLGWAPGKDMRWLADPPTLALLAKSDGRVLRRIGIEGTRTLMDVRPTPEGVLVLAPDRIIVLDDRLAVRAVHTATSDRTAFLTLLPCDRSIVAITLAGLTALDTSGVAWERPMGFRAVWSEAWRGRMAEDEEADADADSTGYLWLFSATGLHGLNPRKGCAPEITFPVTGIGYCEIEHWTVISLSGSTVTLVPMPPPRRP